MTEYQKNVYQISEDLPLVSIIIPSFNQGDFIERTLLSILKQEYSNIEIIVVDGASTDQTLEILRRYSDKYPNVQWLSEKDEGYADAVNKGLKLAKGNIIGIQSSDDYYNSNAIAEAVKLFLCYPEASLVTGRRIRINKNREEVGRSGSQQSRWIDHWDFLEWILFPAQDCTFTKKKAIEAVKGLKKEIDYAADLDLWMRILSLKPGLYVDRYWSFRQHHENQRDTWSRERFGIEARYSVELWLKSPEFPKKLELYKSKIKSFGFLREASYFLSSKNYKKARISLVSALHLYPDIFYVGPCQKYCKKLNIYPQNFYLKTFLNIIKKGLQLLFKNINFHSLITKNRPIQMIELKFNYESNEDFLWYMK
jgi:glycosyltransferase involved in cell wall biosynthesis